MGVFWLLTPAYTKTGQNIGFAWEVADVETVDELTAELQNKGIVAGARLQTVDDGRGGKLVRGRVPTALTVRGIASVMPLQFRVWEPEDSPARELADEATS